MIKGLDALEEIKTCKLIDHVKLKEGLFSYKLLSYERRYGKDVFSEQIPIIEKELQALEIIKEKNIDLKTLKTACLCEGDNKKQCEIYNANRWRWIEDNDFYGSSSVPSKNVTQEEYDLLKEVLL